MNYNLGGKSFEAPAHSKGKRTPNSKGTLKNSGRNLQKSKSFVDQQKRSGSSIGAEFRAMDSTGDRGRNRG